MATDSDGMEQNFCRMCGTLMNRDQQHEQPKCGYCGSSLVERRMNRGIAVKIQNGLLDKIRLLEDDKKGLLDKIKLLEDDKT